MWEDREWQQRARLCSCLLLETVDWWCRTHSEFPVDRIVAAVLRLFSPRCDPFEVPENSVRQTLLDVVGTPAAEYSQTWPHRADAKGCELIASLSRILADAVNRWDEGSLDNPSVEMVSQQIIDEIVAQEYVTFHRNQTTRRDYGGFHAGAQE
jgi:hypothetical protein